MKVLLANDTGSSKHIGCQGVSDGHARMLGRAGHEVTHRIFVGSLAKHTGEDNEIIASLSRDEELAAKVESVDAVVVNGEGTIHHGAGRQWLALLAIAQAKGKATLLVNSVFQETSGFDGVLHRLDDFTVRESRSLKHAHDRGITRARRVPDSILAAKFTPGEPAIRGTVVTDAHKNRADVSAALAEYARRHNATTFPMGYPAARKTWASAVAKIAGADMFVTGRHHGVYLAMLAGLPFVALGGTSFKVEGTLDDIGLSSQMATSVEEIERAAAWAAANRDRFVGLVDRLLNDAPLTTFAALGSAGSTREEAEVRQLSKHISMAPSRSPLTNIRRRLSAALGFR